MVTQPSWIDVTYQVGSYLQITADTREDLDVPDRPFTFGQLITAQAAGDAQVLAEHQRPVLRLNLRDRSSGLDRLRRVLGGTASAHAGGSGGEGTSP